MGIECYAYVYMSLWGEFGLVVSRCCSRNEGRNLILCFTIRELGERRCWRKGEHCLM